jgi:hypothetical protein
MLVGATPRSRRAGRLLGSGAPKTEASKVYVAIFEHLLPHGRGGGGEASAEIQTGHGRCGVG